MPRRFKTNIKCIFAVQLPMPHSFVSSVMTSLAESNFSPSNNKEPSRAAFVKLRMYSTLALTADFELSTGQPRVLISREACHKKGALLLQSASRLPAFCRQIKTSVSSDMYPPYWTPSKEFF